MASDIKIMNSLKCNHHTHVPGPRDSKTKRYGQQAFRYVAPSLWNVLPESIKEKDSIQSFRPSLKTHFFTQG